MIKTPRIEIFGSIDDPEISARIVRLKRYGYDVTVRRREDYASGTGICGKHLCGCTTDCRAALKENQNLKTLPRK
jgi:hypothetical protein